MADLSTTPALHAPYEDAFIELLKFCTKVVDSQPPEVRAELWRGYLEDVKAWREFWKNFHIGFDLNLGKKQ